MALSQGVCPTLFLVGENDGKVLPLKEEACLAMKVHPHLVIVPGASHLFEEPGALEPVTTYAQQWFCTHLSTPF